MGYELYRRKRSGPWSVYFLTREGSRFRRSTKQTDKRLATAVADEWYRRRADPTYQAANETSVAQAVRGLMQALEDAGKRQATRRFYAEKCGHIARLFGPDLPLARIDAKLVDTYIRDRRHEGASRYTVSKELTALRQMLKHARRRGEFDKELSQVMPIGFATGYKPRERRLTMAQAWALIHDLPLGPARYVAFVCATTARDGAVPRARGKHWTADGVLVLDGKTSRSTRLVPVPPLLFAFVRMAFHGVGPDAMVAPGVSSVRHALDRACKRLQLPHVSPNDLRRSVAHWLLEAGVPRDVAAAYMGHANTKMLDLVYGKLDPKELGAALTRALPAPKDDVDLVWTTPADPGDEGDSGRGASSGNTCAGGDLNTGHADFQSAHQKAGCSADPDPVERHVDAVWNPARSVPGIRRSPELERLICVNDSDVTHERRDAGANGVATNDSGDLRRSGAAVSPARDVEMGDGTIRGLCASPGAAECVAAAEREAPGVQALTARAHAPAETRPGLPRKGEGTAQEVARENRVQVATGQATEISLTPATLPAREGGETSEDPRKEPTGRRCGQGFAEGSHLQPAEAPKGPAFMGAPVAQPGRALEVNQEVVGSTPTGSPRHSSHWLGPAGVFVDAFLGRTT